MCLKGGETWGTPAPDSITPLAGGFSSPGCPYRESELDQFLHTGTNENCSLGTD
jgi:hypothetical protein